MKIDKKVFKKLIKECLIEILAEGVGTKMVNEAISNVSKPVSKQMSNNILENLVQAKTNKTLQAKTTINQNPAIQQAIIRESGGNPLMQEIFADTAAKTLPVMLSNDGQAARAAAAAMNSGMSSANISESVNPLTANVDPTDIFSGETVDRWSSLAFGK